EPVGIQVVAEQERRVAVGRREQARAAVVQEVPLVDRLQPERETLPSERREDRLALALTGQTQRLAPEWALPLRLARDPLPEVSARRPRQRPAPSGRSPRPRARAKRTSPRTATGRRTRRVRAGAGRGRRSGRCRWRSPPRSCAPAPGGRRGSPSRPPSARTP